MKTAHQSTSVLHSNNSYVNFSISKIKPQLSCMSFPYCMDEEEPSPQKKIPEKKTIMVSNRLFSDENQKSKNTNFMFKIENEPVPVNEYLSYELSEQINNGLYEVKILAEEIKQIKK